MSYKILVIPPFNRQLKALSKKYPNLKTDLQRLATELSQNPTTGTPLGKDCYKIRLSLTDKKKGKSGGARVITCIRVYKETIYLLAIYDKSEQESISKAEIESLLDFIGTALSAP